MDRLTDAVRLLTTALGLELDDPGFSFSVISQFRALRLATGATYCRGRRATNMGAGRTTGTGQSNRELSSASNQIPEDTQMNT